MERKEKRVRSVAVPCNQVLPISPNVRGLSETSPKGSKVVQDGEPILISFTVLETDPECQLHCPALIDGAGDLIRVGHAADVVHRVEVRAVEDVKDLGLTFER